MADFGKQQDFRKGSILRKLHEDPTYLSFFLAFETADREGSPLLSGAAKDYLTKVLRADEGNKYAKHLENFQKVLMKKVDVLLFVYIALSLSNPQPQLP